MTIIIWKQQNKYAQHLQLISIIINQISTQLRMKQLCSISIKSNSLLTFLSISTMCLLVYASIIIISIIAITPIIILGLGEINAGQRDIILSGGPGKYINATAVDLLSGHVTMPRISVSVKINEQAGQGWFMDLEEEDRQHLGTMVLNREGLAEGQQGIYVHSQYGIKEGDVVNVQFVNMTIFKILAEKFSLDPNFDKELYELDKIMQANISAPFKVLGVFDISFGKFPIGSIGGYVYMQINTALKHIVSHQTKTLKLKDSKLLKYISDSPDFQLSDYSQSLVINIPNRIQIYSNSDYQKTYDYLSDYGSQILKKVGMFSVSSEIPIAAHLTEMSYFGMFIGVILKMIIISLFVLSVLMMNNMMLTGTDRKSFDFALLKTMGANKRFVIYNLIFSSCKYVFVSNIIAFPFAYISLHLISQLFYSFFGYTYNITPTFGAVVGGLLIGVLVPIIASIAPIWGIINNDLVQNLNPIRNKTQAIHTEVYIEGGQFPIGKLLFGAISSCFGLMIYYLLPKGLINQNVGLLLFVFFSILIGLLLGLILLSYSVQYVFEKFIAYLTLFWVNKTDFILTLKNMSAHRFKNRRSSLLYSLSVAFIIFTSVGISIQIQTISQQIVKVHGTQVQIIADKGNLNRTYYDNLLKNQFKDDVIQWAYQTGQLGNKLLMNSQVTKVQFSDKARTFFRNMRVYGISPNYFTTLGIDNTNILKTQATVPHDPYSYLYTPKGFMSCTISQYAAKKFNVLDSNDTQFLINIYKEDRVQRLRLNMSTVFSNRAGLSYSRFDFMKHEIGVSFDTFAQLLGLQTYEQIPYFRARLRVKDRQNTGDLANRLRQRLAPQSHDFVWDYSQTKSTIQRIQSLLKNILTILLVLVLIISFFSLVTTSYINIVNQSNEIGILLTLGYSKSRIVRIFIYESFVLVINSCIIGIVVGTFVAWMMGLQRELFGDFHVKVEVEGIWIIVVAAVVSSVLSIVKPIREIFSKSINQIFVSS